MSAVAECGNEGSCKGKYSIPNFDGRAAQRTLERGRGRYGLPLGRRTVFGLHGRVHGFREAFRYHAGTSVGQRLRKSLNAGSNPARWLNLLLEK